MQKINSNLTQIAHKLQFVHKSVANHPAQSKSGPMTLATKILKFRKYSMNSIWLEANILVTGGNAPGSRTRSAAPAWKAVPTLYFVAAEVLPSRH